MTSLKKKKNIPLTLFERFSVCERELETEQRLQHIDLPSPSGHHRVSFSFPWAAQLGAQPLWDVLIPASSHQLVWSPNSIGGPFCQVVAFSTTSFSDFSDLQLTDFLSSQSYIIVQSSTQSLEWHVWSSSSGNNCHAVHRSLCLCISLWMYHGILPCPISSTKAHLRDFFS